MRVAVGGLIGVLVTVPVAVLLFYRLDPLPGGSRADQIPMLEIERFSGYDVSRQGGAFSVAGMRAEHYADREVLHEVRLHRQGTVDEDIAAQLGVDREGNMTLSGDVRYTRSDTTALVTQHMTADRGSGIVVGDTPFVLTRGDGLRVDGRRFRVNTRTREVHADAVRGTMITR